jgi:hypothetical protein
MSVKIVAIGSDHADLVTLTFVSIVSIGPNKTQLSNNSSVLTVLWDLFMTPADNSRLTSRVMCVTIVATGSGHADLATTTFVSTVSIGPDDSA